VATLSSTSVVSVGGDGTRPSPPFLIAMKKTMMEKTASDAAFSIAE
jgi:hypothetical protein